MHVHRDVPTSGPDPKDEQAGDDRRDPDTRAERDREKAGAGEHSHARDRDARTEPGDHGARERQRDH